MKQLIIVPLFVLVVLILLAVAAVDIHAQQSSAVCLQTTSLATPTNQQKQNAPACTGGTPRRAHSQTQP